MVYVGVGAGDRKGGGLCGRLRYTSGKALTSGLGEGLFDRALADRDWLRERLTEVERGRPMRASQWGKAALARADLYVCWALTESREQAMAFESRVLAVPGMEWWNRAR